MLQIKIKQKVLKKLLKPYAFRNIIFSKVGMAGSKGKYLQHPSFTFEIRDVYNLYSIVSGDQNINSM